MDIAIGILLVAVILIANTLEYLDYKSKKEKENEN